MTYREAIDVGTMVLKEARIEEAKLDAWYLLQMVCKIDKSFFYLHGEEELSAEQKKEYEILLKKRAERIPLQYITGEQEFMGLNFKVNSNVLIPRQDTEILVEEAMRVLTPGMKVLDMCTGSGCIIISLMKLAQGIVGTGVDVSKQALLVARENGRLHEVQVEWESSDLFDRITEKYDMIISNPPYIPTKVITELMPEVCVFEPVEALDGKEDGLFFYEKIIQQAPGYLNQGGYLYFEIGCEQGAAVCSLMKKAGFQDVAVVKDLAHLDRVVKGRLA